jgi:hypothetical protein
MWKIRVDKVINIPLTFSGKAVFMIQNILPAVIAGFVNGFKVEDNPACAGNIYSFSDTDTGPDEYVSSSNISK